MRVLVTGPNGFIARHLLARIPDDWTVHLTAGDISAGLRAPEVDVVFSLAAQVDVARSIRDPRETMQTNTGIALSVVEYARQHDPLVVHVTTAEVFGPGGPYGLHHPARPTNPYAASKAAQDAIFHVARTEGIRVVTVRTQNVYGAYQGPGKFIPTIMRHLEVGEPVQLFGEARRRWVHADTLADNLIRLAQHPTDANITGAHLVDNADIVHAVANIMGVTPRLEVVPPVRAGHESVYDLRPVNMPVPDDLTAGLVRTVTG